MGAYRDSQLGVCIDISGPDGNAFAIMGHYKYYARQLGHGDSYIRATQERMMSTDYENLLDIFEEELGNVVTLIGRN